MSENILIAIIDGAFLLAAVLAPVLLAALISWRYCKTKKELKRYYVALSDLNYMLLVEAEHCRIHDEETGKTYRRLARQIVNAEHTWSRRNSRSRIQSELKRVGKRLKIINEKDYLLKSSIQP